MTLCDYCEVAPTIDHSHVVPRFVGQYIKANSPFRHMLNLWRSKPVFDLHKGPYLCAKCDNETFSRWENYFSRSVWPDPLNSGACLSDERAIQFLVSLAYRYSLHFLATSPIERNRPYSDYLRKLTRSVLKGTSSVGRDLYLYPFVYQPITRQCGLLPGVNHLLNLGVHAESLPREGNLPNAMLVMIPKFLLLLCDGDLRASNECTMRAYSTRW